MPAWYTFAVSLISIVIGMIAGVASGIGRGQSAKVSTDDDELFEAARDGICGKCGSIELYKSSSGIVCSRCYTTFAYTKAHLARLVQEHRLKKVIEDKP